ncbi:anhydro-N-acetylmuramic acid kinase [Flagellimonas oceanensis]|uniref:anhydro-N-acetylmuramic acid kinase n=1 Tax=Flagellimonas oceanensis TaxID=2499163 RepID=UPI000F8D5360|nr:anhydro-N-acetylmuramic acid kinase [Allomuricauda oceanensis]|tara:strand:- start:1227 stop:2315 length:1089 start_codon:yes stop_codon:yes gene_type:complete
MSTYRVLGLMSGTSLDGLDMAYCHIWENDGKWNFSIKNTAEIDYSDEMREYLKNAIHLSEEDHGQLHKDYGIWLGQQSKLFIDELDEEVDFIASHGHTSHHRPEDGVTFQLGDGQLLANTAGKQVVCDFRTKDVSLKGQGAPLVPIGDKLLFHEYDFCLNLGGISNISFDKDGQRIAYDIGLANMPLNYITHKMGLAYDENGKLARSGKLDQSLLQKLNSLPYYSLPYPKSTGYEWFTSEIVPLIEASKASNEDLLYTFIHHNCEQIAFAALKHKNNSKSNSKLLATGGGALNGFFMETLQTKLGSSIEVVVPNTTLIAYKEALVFALMGVLRLEGKNNVLKSVTGATSDSCSGEVFFPIEV